MRSRYPLLFVLSVAPVVAIAMTGGACSSSSSGFGPPPDSLTTTSTSSATTTTSTSSASSGAGGDSGSMDMACSDGGQCPSGVCTPTGQCAIANCMDTVKNGNETDVDCGGSCPTKCADAKGCTTPGDCVDGVCQAEVCLKASCTDMVKNGSESDVDCGGSCTTTCGLGEKCTTATDCSSKQCDPQKLTCLCPIDMVISPIAGGGNYCVDQTEVTYQAYETFWAANPNVVQDQTLCSWNDKFTPVANWPPTDADLMNPVAYIDWCDAAAYCKWQGKHLCSKIGGGTNGYADYADASKSAWFNACSAENNNVYPYGATYDAKRCDGADDAQPDGTIPVTSDATGTPVVSLCAGGAPGLYDMSGDVAEWEDSCDGATGMSDNCRVRGGSYLSSQADLRCDAAASAARNAQQADIGFRCCQ